MPDPHIANSTAQAPFSGSGGRSCTTQVWDKNDAPPKDFPKDLSVYAGLDLSEVGDLTALVLIGKIDGIWHVRPTFWLLGDAGPHQGSPIPKCIVKKPTKTVIRTVIRCVKGLLALNMGEPIRHPNSWWFGET